MNRLIIAAALAVAVGVAGVAATAASGHPHASATGVSALDVHYAQSAAEGDRFEIIGGKLAQSKGATPAVKALGARLVKDHSKSLKELRKTAKALGIKLPKKPSPPESWELKTVAGFSGQAFDRSYARLEIADHKQDIDDASEEAQSGLNTSLRASARKEIPELKKHLKLSRAALKAG